MRYKVGSILVKRGYESKSFSLWEVIFSLETTIPSIEVVPIDKRGRKMMNLCGVYWEGLFDSASSDEILAGKRIF